MASVGLKLASSVCRRAVSCSEAPCWPCIESLMPHQLHLIIRMMDSCDTASSVSMHAGSCSKAALQYYLNASAALQSQQLETSASGA